MAGILLSETKVTRLQEQKITSTCRGGHENRDFPKGDPSNKDLDTVVNHKKTSYKTIHYERQTQLKINHTFNLNPFHKTLPNWCSRAPIPYKTGQSFVLRFDFTLPDRRKIKRGAQVFDLTSAKEYEAAQTGLMYARSMFDLLTDELYNCTGYIFDTGLQVGPSRAERGEVKTSIVLFVPAVISYREINPADVLTFAAHAIFSADELNHMKTVTATLYFDKKLLGSMDITCESTFNGMIEIAEKYYFHRSIQEILYNCCENRNILYAFNQNNTLRQGMMVETDTGWVPVEIHTQDDIYRCVKDFGVVEFIPAVNRIDEDYPSIITIETDPGEMLMAVLGKKKSWIFNTYVAEKICRLLDAYCITYQVKFSGNKGWHIQIPLELKKPFNIYQQVVEAIIDRQLSGLSEQETVLALILNFMQSEDVKSYTDPFFVARRFVDLVGARIMFYELDDIHTVLTLNDLRNLCLRAKPVHKRRSFNIYETQVGPVKVEIPQVLSINPYSKFRRQFKLLIDHSSNKREGKLRSILSMHSKSGLVSIPAVLHTEKGLTRFDKNMWDFDFVGSLADPEQVCSTLDDGAERYPLLDLAKKWEINSDFRGFEKFLDDHKGLLIYLLQNGGEALELLDTATARWVNGNLWERTVKG